MKIHLLGIEVSIMKQSANPRENMAHTHGISECTGHGIPYGAPESGFPFWVRRCAHLDNRFVVEIRRDAAKPCFVDYVEDLSDSDIIVEACHPGTERDVAEVWNDMVARMMDGQGPERDRW